MQVYIYLHTISRFLHGPDYQPLVNTTEIDNHLEKIRKITQKQIGSEKNICHFKRIMWHIESNSENTVWVVGSP